MESQDNLCFEYHKGEICPKDEHTLCQEGFCYRCSIAEKLLTKSQKETLAVVSRFLNYPQE